MFMSSIGVALIVFACAMIWTRGYGPHGRTSIQGPKRGKFTTVFPSLVVLLFGVVLLVAGQLRLPSLARASQQAPQAPAPDRANHASTKAATTSDAKHRSTLISDDVAPTTSGGLPPILAPVAPPSAPNGCQPSPSPTPSSTPEPSAGENPSTNPSASQPGPGPWSDTKGDVKLVVERIKPGRGVDGHLMVSLRIENDSADDISFDDNAFMAIDSYGNSFGDDTEHSTFAPADYAPGDLGAHKAVRGSVVLDDTVPRGADQLDVYLTYSKDTWSGDTYRLAAQVPIDPKTQRSPGK